MHVFIDKNDRQNRGFLAVDDEAKFEAYLSSVGKAKDSPEAKGFETLRREINRFPADYKESPSKKLTKAQFESYAKIEALEKQVTAWEKTKEKIKKMLWWDDIAKGLAQLNQQNDTSPENGEATSTPTAPTTATDTTPSATLSADGKAWFIHPITMHIFNFENCVCNKCINENQFKSIIPNDILHNGLFYKMNNDLKHTSLSTFLLKLNKYFIQYNVNSCLQKAHFISQILCESDFFRTAEEYKNKDGSTPSHWNNYKGGANYHGRGLIQITHDYNYDSFGKYINNNTLKDSPDIVCSSLDFTIESAFWYWINGSAWGNINSVAKNNDFLKVTMAINGGYNHVVERNKALITLYDKFNIKNCLLYHDVKFDNYSFGTSAMINSKWYENNKNKVQEVEEALRNFYTTLQKEN